MLGGVVKFMLSVNIFILQSDLRRRNFVIVYYAALPIVAHESRWRELSASVSRAPAMIDRANLEGLVKNM